jgi:hypothetical protein
LPSFRGAGGDSVLMKKQAAEVRITVRIPKNSDLKPRIAAAARTIGVPESLLVVHAVEAAVRHSPRRGS